MLQILQDKGLKSLMPPHTQDHKTARLKFARNHMTWYEEWKNVVFFNTKSNLHEPAAFKYYSHNLRTDKVVAMSRNFDGGCLIVWTAFNYSKMSICKICIKTQKNILTY